MAKRRGSKALKRPKVKLEKDTWFKYIVLPCAFIFVATMLYLFWYNNNNNATYEGIEYIKSFIGPSGKLNDYQNKIGMKVPEEDIRWYKTDDEIRIEFGRIFLTWEPKDFYTEENLRLLQSIGITVEVKTKSDGTKKLHIYYNDIELERWIK